MWIVKRRQRRLAVGSAGRVPAWVDHAYNAVRVIVGILIGFEIGGALLMFLQYPKVEADRERQRSDELASENDRYCKGWGFHAGSYAYDRCTLDLDQIRQNERERLERDRDFFP